MATANNVPKMTTAELQTAEQVAYLLLPAVAKLVRDTVAARDGGTVSQFCRAFADAQRARECLPSSAPPMARAELDAQLLDLAGAFVAAHSPKG